VDDVYSCSRYKTLDVALNSGLPSGTSMLRRRPMRMLVVVTAALLVAALPLASAQNRRHREQKHVERAQIVALEAEWKKAVLADDIPVMDKLLSEDYLGITPGGEVLTKTSSSITCEMESSCSPSSISLTPGSSWSATSPLSLV